MNGFIDLDENDCDACPGEALGKQFTGSSEAPGRSEDEESLTSAKCIQLSLILRVEMAIDPF
jgi:hypothetical protein